MSLFAASKSLLLLRYSFVLLLLALATTAVHGQTNGSAVLIMEDDDQSSSNMTSVNDSANDNNNTDVLTTTTGTTDNTTTSNGTATSTMNNSTNSSNFEGCDLSDYYADLNVNDIASWTLLQVQSLLETTHRRVLPSVGASNEEENVLTALIDLDPGTSDNSVFLYDREIDFDADKQNIPEGWKRGDVWPLSRGADLETDAGTDLHGKRPADWEVTSELKDLFWGECGTVETEANCVRPAIPNQTAPSTAQDRKIKTPPESMRGAVARSVLYTAVRYGTELGLTLTDCPPFDKTDYGYLSELLRWHKAYPATDDEIKRNSRACSRWQGNRNPFVDFPELVAQFFGEPDQVMEGQFMYSKCALATDSPTATPNECSALVTGDVYILIFNTDPVDQVVLFPLVDIPASIGSLFVTDRAWNGTDFCATDEGTIEYSIPPEGRKAGKVFGYNVKFPDDTGTWETVDDSTFDLSTLQPDNMFVYCLNADDKPHFLHALTYNDNGFANASGCDVSGTSLPDDFVAEDGVASNGRGTLALPFAPNYVYEGTREGNKVELLAAFADPANYKGSNTPYDIVTSGAATSTAITMVALIACLLFGY